MPYTHRKIGDKECVFKKDTGAKVGCTKGDVKDYLAALHANANESTNEINIDQPITEDKIKGGKADNLTKNDIANKFDLPVSKIDNELRKGKKVEGEHTSSTKLAKEIALDHLSEFPDYYTRLEKMEKEAEKYWKEKAVKENRKGLIKKLLRENLDEGILNKLAMGAAIIGGSVFGMGDSKASELGNEPVIGLSVNNDSTATYITSGTDKDESVAYKKALIKTRESFGSEYLQYKKYMEKNVTKNSDGTFTLYIITRFPVK